MEEEIAPEKPIIEEVENKKMDIEEDKTTGNKKNNKSKPKKQ